MKRITLSNRITSVLICICFIVTTVIGTVGNAIIANASLRVSAEELFGEGAMYLDEFLGQHPDALINGRPLIMPLAIGGDTPKTATLDKEWFKATIKLQNDNRASEEMGLDTLFSEYGGEWENPESGGMKWATYEYGGLLSESGYPFFDVGDYRYGVISAYAKNVRVYNVGLVEVNGKARLWVSVTQDGDETSAVVFKDEEADGQVILNYGIIEFPLTYEVWVDGVLQEVDVSYFGLNDVFGEVRSNITQKQTTSFPVTIPEPQEIGTAYTARVYINEKEVFPQDWGGDFALGTDPVYNEGISGRSGPNRYSLSETYSPEKGERIKEPATIKVELKKRTSFTQNAQVWVNNTGHVSGIGNGTGAEVTYHDDGSYDWTFTFQVDGAAGVIGIGSKTYSLSTLYINGEMFNVPYLSFSDMVNKGVWKGGEYIPDSPDKHSTEAFLSSGERVKITITKAYDHASVFGDYGTYYYKVEIFGSYRDLIVSNGDIVENDKGSFISFKRITTLNKVTDGLGVKLYYRDGPYSNTFRWHTLNKSDSVDTYKIWDPLQIIKVGRFEYGKSDENGGNISVKLKDGYVFPGAGKDDVSPDVIENAVRSWARGMDDTDGEIGSGYIGLKKGSDGSYYGLLNEDPSPDTFLKDSISYIDIETKPVQIKYKLQYMDGLKDGSALNAGNPDLENKEVKQNGVTYSDAKTYTQSDSNFSFGSLPTGTEDGDKFAGDYWVLTDKDGKPVDKNGKSASSKDDWITFSDGDVGNVRDYIEYTHSNASGFATDDTDGAPVHTIYFTAYWKVDNLITYTHYVTANITRDEDGKEDVRRVKTKNSKDITREHIITKVDLDRNDEIYIEDGRRYHRINPETGEAYKREESFVYKPSMIENVVFPMGQFSDPDNITVDKDTIVKEFGTRGGVYKWYKLDDDENPNDYVWNNIWDQDEVPVWFSRNLGGMTFTNKIDGAEYSGIDKALTFKITFKITEDEQYTAGNELNFFEEAADLGVLPEGYTLDDITKTIDEDGTCKWEIKVELKDGESITFPYLPTDMTYEIELDPTPGYRMHNADGEFVYSKSVQKHYGGTVGVVEDFGGMEKEVEREYFKGKVESYDDQKVEITVFGTYLIDLKQAVDDPAESSFDEDEEDFGLKYTDKLDYVENFHHLYYQATVQNLTSKSQTIRTVINVDNGGGRRLNIEKILGEDINWNPEDIPDGTMTGVNGNVSWVYSGADRTITFTETIEPGGERTYEIVNSIPAVDGETIYTATANLQDSVGNDIEADQPELKDGKLLTTPKDKPQVTAYAYSYWLRILAYCDDDPNAVFTIKTGLTGTFNYYLFNDENTYGQGNGIWGTTSGEITLKHGQRVVIYGLSEGTEYEVTSDGFDSNGKQYAVYHSITDSPIAKDDYDMAIFRFVPTKKLTVTKNAKNKNGGDLSSFSFNFKATLTSSIQFTDHTDLELDYRTIDWKSENKDNEFTLTNTNPSVEFIIPDGCSYSIEETNPGSNITSSVTKEEGVEISTGAGTTATGTVNGKDQTVIFTNQETDAGFTISKQVDGSLLDGDIPEGGFPFTITVSRGSATGESTFQYIIYNEDGTKTDKEGTLNLKVLGSYNPTANIRLMPGQYVRITPPGGGVNSTANHTITVTEGTYSSDNSFITTVNGNNGVTITGKTVIIEKIQKNASTAYVATFINTRHNGNLTIEKVVENDPKDKNTEFKFDVTLNKANGDLLGTKNDGSKYVFGGVEFDENGKGVVTVKANDSFTIEGIPTGLTYEVTEQNMDGYSFVRWENDNSGTITKDVTDKVTCYNTALTHSLTIKNIVKGNMASLQQEFPFEIKLFDNDGELLTGVFQIIITNGGETISDNNYVVNGSSGIISLKHGDILTIVGLPPEITYEITEIEQKGYDVEIDVTPSDDDVKIVDNITASGTLKGNVIVTFTNELDGNIPTGVDTEQGWLISMFILTAFGALVIFLKRRIDKTGGRPP